MNWQASPWSRGCFQAPCCGPQRSTFAVFPSGMGDPGCLCAQSGVSNLPSPDPSCSETCDGGCSLPNPMMSSCPSQPTI